MKGELSNSQNASFVSPGKMTRRQWLGTAAAAVATVPLLHAQGSKRLLLGAFVMPPGKPFPGPGDMGASESDDPELLAQECKRLGYTAAYCPLAKPGDTARVNAIRNAFARAGIVIAEVGAWKNLMTPDARARKANLEYVTEQMALADEVGARCCVDIAGSFDGNTLSGPHPKNLSQEFIEGTVENCRYILDAVKPKRSFFTIEMKAYNFPNGPDEYLQLIKAVDRPAFGVHIDICNAINSPSRFYNNTALIRDCFAKLGRWVRSCHGKDLKWIPDVAVHFEETVPGRGGIASAGIPGVDYRTYIQEIVKTGAPLMLEHLKSAEEYQEGANYVRKVAAGIGVQV
jgi:sugar phosphate isomerase/epimerase